MSPELVTAITGLVTAVGVLIAAVATVYFKLREQLDVIHGEVNHRYTELMGRLDDMTAQRDTAQADADQARREPPVSPSSRKPS